MELSNKPGRGVLFPKTKKASENQPDFEGGVNLNGVEYRLVAWERRSKKGARYLSVAISELRESEPHDPF